MAFRFHLKLNAVRGSTQLGARALTSPELNDRWHSNSIPQLPRLVFDKPLLADSVDLRGSCDETTMPRTNPVVSSGPLLRCSHDAVMVHGRSNTPTADSSEQAEFVLPDRRAVAAALQTPEDRTSG